jgi:hypothetical protein
MSADIEVRQQVTVTGCEIARDSLAHSLFQVDSAGDAGSPARMPVRPIASGLKFVFVRGLLRRTFRQSRISPHDQRRTEDESLITALFAVMRLLTGEK